MSAAHSAQLWALEHILEAGVDTDVIDEIIGGLTCTLGNCKSRLSLALLRNALRDGSPVEHHDCKLLAKIGSPPRPHRATPRERTVSAEIFAAVILDAPDWDVFRRHRDVVHEGCRRRRVRGDEAR